MNTHEMTLDVSNPRCLMELADATADAAALMDRLQWARLERMRGRLMEVLAKEEYGALVRSIRRIFQRMSAPRRARVLLSSELCEYLIVVAGVETISQRTATSSHSREAELTRALVAIHDLMERECALADLANGKVCRFLRGTRRWRIDSPSGDCLAEKTDEGEWSVRAAPIIGGCIALDFDSPLARHHEESSGVMSQRALAFTGEERLGIKLKLEQAITKIDRAEPLYGALIRNFVRRIILRKSHESDDEGSRRFGSEHAPRQPGSLRLLNTHHPDLEVAACMESLMHEATHNFLAAWELTHTFFVPTACAYRVVSPWSGNQIPNASYIHAVFVYYICHRLLKLHLSNAADLPFSERDHVRRRLAGCAVGFLVEQKLSSRLTTSSPLPEAISQSIDLMQRKMKDEYRASALG